MNFYTVYRKQNCKGVLNGAKKTNKQKATTNWNKNRT